MLKIAQFLFLLVCCLCFTGCIDIFQHITRESNGTEQNTIKITTSKMVLAMANGLSDDDADYERLFNESEMNSLDIDEYKAYSASVTKVNDLMDFGYLLDMNINYRDRTMVNNIMVNKPSFIPIYEGKKATIHIDSMGDQSDVEENEIALAFLSTGKYRLLINKSCMPNITQVVMRNTEGAAEISFQDLYDEYLIEIPIVLFFMSDIDLEIYS